MVTTREDINRKNVFFRALPESRKHPPPPDPNSGNLVLCFFTSKMTFCAYDRKKFDADKGSHPVRKVQFFLTLFKRPLIPPPLSFEHHVVNLKCCINVGFREAPCKKSFGILASYWTPPPKIK